MAVQSRIHEAGNIEVLFTSEESDVIRNLADRQELSYGKVLTQALRLYQSTVFPLPEDGPYGCAGD